MRAAGYGEADEPLLRPRARVAVDRLPREKRRAKLAARERRDRANATRPGTRAH